MGAPKRRAIPQSRKRVVEEGEEEGGITPPVEDDSLSDISVGSDEDADAEASENSGTELSVKNHGGRATLTNGHRQGDLKSSLPPEQGASLPTLGDLSKDTEAMMHGLQISNDKAVEEVQFENLAESADVQQASGLPASTASLGTADRRRKEHEEYKKRRDADPAFVPNRGDFFMHDHRSSGPGQNGFRPFGRGNARGRGVPRPSFHGLSHAQAAGPAEAPWTHDLHESVAASNAKPSLNRPSGYDPRLRQSHPASTTSPAPNRDFSTTTLLGDMQVRLFLEGMKEPRTFSAIARYSYTRLPFHRPPLRRDKPVRVSIPNMDIKYIFPPVDRSFIFIPRALRPNQQGFGKPRGRGSFGGPGYVNFGPFSSRKTSMYGGSNYSPNAVLSRRSSLAREVTGTAGASPAQALGFQLPANAIDAAKPVVRLPPAMEQFQQQPPNSSPADHMPQNLAYASLQDPAFQENRPEDLPMHHPKPKRSLPVGEIVSPSAVEVNSPSIQQPFHQQVPTQVSTQVYGPPSQQNPHSRHPSHPSQTSGSTPLPQIPEAGVHAPPFQPYAYPAQGYYPVQYPMYYYTPADHGTNSPIANNGFLPGQPYFYPMGVAAPPPPPPPETTTQAGTVAHEAGGTVYYYNPADLNTDPSTSSPYPSTYPPASAAGMATMMPPSFYPQNPVFYPPNAQ